MNDKVRYNFDVLVKRGQDDNGSYESFCVEVEEDASIGKVARDFLLVFNKQYRDYADDERPFINIFIDDEADLEQCLMILAEDEGGEFSRAVDLNLSPGAQGCPPDSRFQLRPGQFIVGGDDGGSTGLSIVSASIPARGSGSKRPQTSPPQARGSVPPLPRPSTIPAPVLPPPDRVRRIRIELAAFQRMVAANPSIIQVVSPEPLGQVWKIATPLIFRLTGVKGWAMKAGGGWEMRDEHLFKLVFPPDYPDSAFRFYCDPSRPPVFHPNVNPKVEGGGHYICLFPETRKPRDRSIIDAIMRLEAEVQWRAYNLAEVDAMNHEAQACFDDPTKTGMRSVQSSIIRAVNLTAEDLESSTPAATLISASSARARGPER